MGGIISCDHHIRIETNELGAQSLREQLQTLNHIKTDKVRGGVMGGVKKNVSYSPSSIITMYNCTLILFPLVQVCTIVNYFLHPLCSL